MVERDEPKIDLEKLNSWLLREQKRVDHLEVRVMAVFGLVLVLYFLMAAKALMQS